MERIKKVIGILFMVAVMSDILIYGISALVAEVPPNLQVWLEGSRIVYQINTGALNGERHTCGTLYITEKDNDIIFRYAKPVKTNYFLSNMWGDSVIYVMTESRVTLNPATMEIKEADADYLAQSKNLFLTHLGDMSYLHYHKKVGFVGVTLQEQPFEALQVAFKKSFNCANSQNLWVVAGSVEKEIPEMNVWYFL